MKFKRKTKIGYLFVGFAFLISNHLQAQFVKTLNLQTCLDKAEQHYPLVRQYALLEKSEGYTLDQVAAGNLPQIKLGGQWSYQSDVTKIPFALPNTDIPAIDKDQYKIYVDVSQPLTDLFTTQKHKKELAQKEATVQAKALDAEIFKVRERINHLYFGILLMDRQIAQALILEKQIKSGIKINEVAVNNGTALKSSTSLLEAENLKVQKRLIDLKVNRKDFIKRLALFIGENLDEHTVFKEPEDLPVFTKIERPELQLFDAQKDVFKTQKKLIDDLNLPNLNLFGQGGYGKPGLNMLSNQTELYYITGLRLSWNISRLYTQKRDKQQLDIKQELLEAEQDSFLFNTNQSLEAHTGEIDKMDALIAVDREIIERRREITNTAAIQLENGVVTTNDYLGYLNAEDEARQELLLHQIKRLKAMYDHKTTTGN